MKETWGVIQEMSADEREREEAEAAEKACPDLLFRIRYVESKSGAKGYVYGSAAGHSDGYTYGLIDSLTEDIEKGTFFRLFYMLGQGRSAKEISAATGIPIEKVVATGKRMSKKQLFYF